MHTHYKTIGMVLELGLVIFVLAHPLLKNLVPRVLRWNAGLPASRQYRLLSRWNRLIHLPPTLTV